MFCSGQAFFAEEVCFPQVMCIKEGQWELEERQSEPLDNDQGSKKSSENDYNGKFWLWWTDGERASDKT